MNLRSRIAALAKRHQAGMVERISRMGGDERVALVRRMFADRAEQAGPEHAAQIRAAAVWFLDAGGTQHPEGKRIVQAVFDGQLSEDELKIINNIK